MIGAGNRNREMMEHGQQFFGGFDWIMFLVVLLVTCMSLANLYSATYAGVGTALFIRQLVFFGAGFGFIFVILLFDYRLLLTWNYYLFGIVILLLLAALFVGGTVASTQRWINLGFFRLQPSEPAKLMLVISLASYYARKDTGLGFSIRQLLVPAALTGLPFFLIYKQPDLGTALMLIFIFASMTLFVKIRWSTIVILVLAVAVLLPVGWKYGLKDYQRQRIETFLNKEGDPMKSGYQIRQSMIAVGSGLKFGRGYLNGTQSHLHFLPERHTDFAFAVWAEEWGFAGSLLFLGSYFFMILWGVNIGISARDRFGVLLAFGVVALIFWQAIINLFMVMGFLPVVGIPLPLFSYGGSSLMTTMIGLGILMNVRARRRHVGK